MNRRAEFIASIAAEPDDDALRLIYCDWLEENGDAARAEFVRLEIAVEAGHCQNGTKAGRKNRDGVGCCWQCHYCEQYRKQAMLLSMRGERWFKEDVDLIAQVQRQGWGFSCFLVGSTEFQRGFIEELAPTIPFWITHGPCIVKRCPLRKVRFPVALQNNGWLDTDMIVELRRIGILAGHAKESFRIKAIRKERSLTPDKWSLTPHNMPSDLWLEMEDVPYKSVGAAYKAISDGALRWARKAAVNLQESR